MAWNFWNSKSRNNILVGVITKTTSGANSTTDEAGLFYCGDAGLFKVITLSE